MKNFCILVLMLISASLSAAESNQEWKDTALSESAIKNIQQAKYKYLQCVGEEIKKKSYAEMDTRAATDKIIQQCENPLTAVREVFVAEKVPASIADRYLKRTRTQTARKILEQMMYAAAARDARK